MKKISEQIDQINKVNRKALSIFLTAGYPSENNFVELAFAVLESGADILEIGIPFSDPLADGPVIQTASQSALEKGVTLKTVFELCEKIKSKTDKSLILMGYANPILKYGHKNFINDSVNSGVSGLIVPDVPLEEYDSFYNSSYSQLEKILLTTPTSSYERIKSIDSKSEGFVYCVSVTGTTGAREKFDNSVLKNIERTYSVITKNKMMIGFGISTPGSIRTFKSYCDGIIIGSAVIKKIAAGVNNSEFRSYIKSLSDACS